jgi:hypothetical protein
LLAVFADVKLERIEVPNQRLEALKTKVGPTSFSMLVSARTGFHIKELVDEIGSRYFNGGGGGGVDTNSSSKSSKKEKGCLVQ